MDHMCHHKKCDSRVGSLRIEEIFGNLLMKADAQDEILNEMKVDISSINQNVESHMVDIK